MPIRSRGGQGDRDGGSDGVMATATSETDRPTAARTARRPSRQRRLSNAKPPILHGRNSPGFPRCPRQSATTQAFVSPHFESSGGPVLLRLTGWADDRAIAQLEATGLRPMRGHERVERLDSLGMNTVAGTIPAGWLDSIMAVRYVVAIEPAN